MVSIQPLQGSSFGAEVHGLHLPVQGQQQQQELRQAWYGHGGLLVFKGLPPDAGASAQPALLGAAAVAAAAAATAALRSLCESSRVRLAALRGSSVCGGG
eukprot:COSAG02_NODE_3079_length_7411_cov_31.125957_3_plen_100_part_00